MIITFLFSYILVLFIPLFLGSFVYNKVISIVERNAVDSNLSMLEQTKTILDSQLREIEIMSFQLSQDPKTSMFFNTGKVDNNVLYDITSYITMLKKSYWITNNDFMIDIFVYFKDMDKIVSSKTFYDFEDFYGEFYKFGNMSIEQFKSSILSKTYNMTYLRSLPLYYREYEKSDGALQAVTYLQSIPIGLPTKTEGTIITHINNEKLIKLLQPISTNNKGWAYITDSKGNIITSTSDNTGQKETFNEYITDVNGYKEVSASNEKEIIIYTTSERNGWKYVAVVPANVIMNKANNVKFIMEIVVLIALVCGIAISYVFSYKNTRPIENTVTVLKDFLGNEIDYSANEYSILNNSINRIIGKNLSLKDAMEKNKPLVCMALLNHIFRGDYNNVQEVAAATSTVNLDIKGNLYTVGMFRIHGYGELKNREILDELSMKKIIINDVIKEEYGREIFLHDAEENRTAVMFISHLTDKYDFMDNIEKTLQRACDRMYKEYNIKLSVTLGEIYDNIGEVWRSFNEANTIMNYNYYNNDYTVMWHSEMKSNSERYNYTLDFELKLMNYIKGGDKENLSKLLSELHNNNFVERKLSRQMKQRLIFELSGTFIKIADQINVDEKVDEAIENMEKCETIQELYDYIVKNLYNLCEEINSQKKSRNIVMKEKIIDIIKSSYMKSDVCLCKIAEEVGLSEVYLSQFFKEQTGENLSNYLERLRIEEACKLLSKTNLSVNEIAASVGYNSDHVFRRAFKKHKCVSPSEYKNILTT